MVIAKNAVMRLAHLSIPVSVVVASVLSSPVQAIQSRVVTSGGVDSRVVAVDLERDRLELRWRDRDGHPIATIERLREGADGAKLLFATNAGIYDREFRPLGLHIEAGKALRALNATLGNAARGNFSIPPNGVFWVDNAGKAGVTTTADWREQPRDARLASQSGPMLVVDGAINARFEPASESRKWRSGVCSPDGRTAVFAVSLAPVSFHAFATLFRDDLQCRDALYLDGSLSQIWTAGDGYSGAPPFMVKPYVGIFAVFDDGDRGNPAGKPNDAR